MRLATARKSSSVGDEQSGKMEGISSSSPSLKLPSRTLVHDILPLPPHAARHVTLHESSEGIRFDFSLYR